MMTSEIANSWWMYLMAAVVCLFVLSGSVVFIVKSCRDAKRIGMDLKYLKKTALISALFTLIPSVSILIGVIALSGTLGVPFPWIRLSVIGALHYEGAAAKTVYEGALSGMTTGQFVTIAFVMTLGILSGPVYCLFGFKAYDKKILSKAKAANEEKEDEKSEDNAEQSKVEEKPKAKKSFGPILFTAAFIAMICSFLAEDIAKLLDIGKENVSSVSSYLPAIVIVVSFASMALFDLIVKKTGWKWLDNFALGLSMLLGMASAILFA